MQNLLQAAIFDMDGVIVDNFTYHNKAWLKFCDLKNITITEDHLKNTLFGKTNNEILPDLFQERLTSEEIQALADEKEEIYRQIYADEIKAVTGLQQFLQELLQKQIKTAVATSGPRANLEFVLEKLDIGQYFQILVTAENIKNGKPHPEIYLKAAKMLNIQPKNCFVFEDSHAGIQSGNNAGMKVIGLSTTHQANQLHNTLLTTPDFTELSVSELELLMHK